MPTSSTAFSLHRNSFSGCEPATLKGEGDRAASADLPAHCRLPHGAWPTNDRGPPADDLGSSRFESQDADSPRPMTSMTPSLPPETVAPTSTFSCALGFLSRFGGRDLRTRSLSRRWGRQVIKVDQIPICCEGPRQPCDGQVGTARSSRSAGQGLDLRWAGGQRLSGGAARGSIAKVRRIGVASRGNSHGSNGTVRLRHLN